MESFRCQQLFGGEIGGTPSQTSSAIICRFTSEIPWNIRRFFFRSDTPVHTSVGVNSVNSSLAVSHLPNQTNSFGEGFVFLLKNGETSCNCLVIFTFYHGMRHHQSSTAIWENIFDSLFPTLHLSIANLSS